MITDLQTPSESCSLLFTVWFTVFHWTLRFSFKNRKADRRAEKLRKFTVSIYGFTVLRLRFTVTVTVTVRLRSTMPTVTRGMVRTTKDCRQLPLWEILKFKAMVYVLLDTFWIRNSLKYLCKTTSWVRKLKNINVTLFLEYEILKVLKPWFLSV